MSIKILQKQDQFQALKEQWNALLEKSASHVPFLRHEYQTSWWDTLGGGEWSQGELMIGVDIQPSGSISGIAPFFLHEDTILFIGSYQISDYLDFIVEPGKLASFTDRLLNHLVENHSERWTKMDLYNLLEDSPTLETLLESARDRGWQVKKQQIQPAPCLTLPESWESYLNRLESRYRHEIERKLRRAESYFLPVEWYIVTDEAHLESEIEDFLELMAYHDEKAEFLTDLMASQMKKAVREAFHAGWLQLVFLQVGDIKAAGYLNFDFQDRIWIYNSGLNPMFENISPGWVLLGYLIQWAIEHKKKSVDFMRGDEAYKYQFGGKDRAVIRLQINRG